MKNNEGRRRFLRYGFIAVATLFAVTTSVKFNNDEKFAVGKMKMPQLGVAEAHAVCGLGMGCGGQ